MRAWRFVACLTNMGSSGRAGGLDFCHGLLGLREMYAHQTLELVVQLSEWDV